MSAVLPTQCASCGHALESRYCSRCGEEVLDGRKLTVWYFLTHTLVEEILSLDGKIWRTLRFLLFRPGFLALEYAAGRRRPYVKPLRVLIVAIIAYALSNQSGMSITLSVGQLRLSIAPVSFPLSRSVEGTLTHIDRLGLLERMFRDRVGPVESASEAARSRLNSSLRSFATPLSFTSVVLLALALYACFWRRRPLLVEHAVFSMHYFSFVLLTSMLGIVIIRSHLIPGAFLTGISLLALSFWQFVYLATGIRRFYSPLGNQRVLAWVLAILIALLAYFLNAFFITILQMIVGAIAILRM